MKKNRIAPSFLNLLKIYVPIYLLTTIIFYLLIGVVWPPTLYHYLLLLGWTLLTLFYLIFGYTQTTYEVTKHQIIHHKGKTTLYYNYKEIIYIDEKYSSKKGSIRFVTSQGHERYLMHDKGKIVYHALLENATNLKPRDEVNRLFPSLKL